MASLPAGIPAAWRQAQKAWSAQSASMRIFMDASRVRGTDWVPFNDRNTIRKLRRLRWPRRKRGYGRRHANGWGSLKKHVAGLELAAIEPIVLGLGLDLAIGPA